MAGRRSGRKAVPREDQRPDGADDSLTVECDFRMDAAMRFILPAEAGSPKANSSRILRAYSGKTCDSNDVISPTFGVPPSYKTVKACRAVRGCAWYTSWSAEPDPVSRPRTFKDTRTWVADPVDWQCPTENPRITISRSSGVCQPLLTNACNWADSSRAVVLMSVNMSFTTRCASRQGTVPPVLAAPARPSNANSRMASAIRLKLKPDPSGGRTRGQDAPSNRNRSNNWIGQHPCLTASR